MDVIVTAEPDTERIGNFIMKISFPQDQPKLSVAETAHILAAGISLLVKCCSKDGVGIKDYELIAEIMEHLNGEFGDIKSYSDSAILNKGFKNIEDGTE